MSPISHDQIFDWHSSEVDWCEGNYEVTEHIVEFYNTISNVLFLLLAPLLCYLFRHYAYRVTWEVNMVWLLMALVGIGSIWFHATLSLFGQMLDELSIIWLFMYALSLWCPKRSLPMFFQENVKLFRFCIMLVTVIGTASCFVNPSLNNIGLFIMLLPVIYYLITETMHSKDPAARRLVYRSSVTLAAACVMWLVDNVLCSVWRYVGLTYMHGMWHILIALAGYQACVIFCWYDVQHRFQEELPVLQYWPAGNYEFLSIPYVSFESLGEENEKKHSSQKKIG